MDWEVWTHLKKQRRSGKNSTKLNCKLQNEENSLTNNDKTTVARVNKIELTEINFFFCHTVDYEISRELVSSSKIFGNASVNSGVRCLDRLYAEYSTASTEIQNRNSRVRRYSVTVQGPTKLERWVALDNCARYGHYLTGVQWLLAEREWQQFRRYCKW